MRTAIALTAVVMAQAALAQEGGTRQTPVYRLQFSVHELENSKRIGTKDFAMLTVDNNWGRINIGTRVPAPSGGAAANTQWQYIDVGMQLQAKISERDSQLVVEMEASMNGPIDQDTRMPVALRNMSTKVTTAVPLGKPTTVFTMDDPGTKRRYEIEVTVTRVK